MIPQCPPACSLRSPRPCAPHYTACALRVWQHTPGQILGSRLPLTSCLSDTAVFPAPASQRRSKGLAADLAAGVLQKWYVQLCATLSSTHSPARGGQLSTALRAVAQTTPCTPSRLPLQIHFMMLMSRQGKVRLAKWYNTFTQKDRARITREITPLILTRPLKLCNFLDWKNYKLIYKRYASLYFLCAVDVGDNELITLEIIHEFVEASRSHSHACMHFKGYAEAEQLLRTRRGSSAVQSSLWWLSSCTILMPKFTAPAHLSVGLQVLA